MSATNIYFVVSLANTSYQRWLADSHRWQTKISAASFDLSYGSILRGEFLNILQHLLPTAFIFCFQPIRLKVT